MTKEIDKNNTLEKSPWKYLPKCFRMDQTYCKPISYLSCEQTSLVSTALKITYNFTERNCHFHCEAGAFCFAESEKREASAVTSKSLAYPSNELNLHIHPKAKNKYLCGDITRRMLEFHRIRNES